MKNRFFPNYYKLIFIAAGALVSLFLSTLFTDLLLFESLSFYSNTLVTLAVGAAVVLLFSFLVRLHAVSLRHASVTEIARASIVSFALFISVIIVYLIEDKTTLPWCVIASSIFFILFCSFISSYRIYVTFRLAVAKSSVKDAKRVLIVGAGGAGTSILRELRTTDKINDIPVGFIDDDPHKIGTTVLGVKVLGNCESIAEIAKR